MCMVVNTKEVYKSPHAGPISFMVLFWRIPRNSNSSANPVDSNNIIKPPISSMGVNWEIKGSGLRMKNSMIPVKKPVSVMRSWIL